jgi:hypothetical protein
MPPNQTELFSQSQGKGVMETFWLIGPDNFPQPNRQQMANEGGGIIGGTTSGGGAFMPMYGAYSNQN